VEREPDGGAPRIRAFQVTDKDLCEEGWRLATLLHGRP
jgi:hypothetical protein